MPAVTKAELVDNLFDVLGVNKREAKDIVEAIFGEIVLSLENNRDVKIAGFGNFKLRDKKQRPGRNPKTGEVIPVSPRRVVSFKIGQKLKKRIEENVASPSQSAEQ